MIEIITLKYLKYKAILKYWTFIGNISNAKQYYFGIDFMEHFTANICSIVTIFVRWLKSSHWNIWNTKPINLKYWSFIGNIFFEKPMFPYCWLYIAKISNVRQCFFEIGLSLEIFSVKDQQFGNICFSLVLFTMLKNPKVEICFT